MSKINVFITLDTEHSIGGAFRDVTLKPVGNEKRIFGKIGNKFFGIPFIIDIADAFKIPLTFFVEVLNKYYFGEKETKEVCEYIIKRGHDVQLHLHPNYLSFAKSKNHKAIYSDQLATYSFSEQCEFIEEGVRSLSEHGAKRAIAFRAGGFGANNDTLKALRENGFLIDASYNRAYIGEYCLFDDRGVNDLINWDGIWEFPVTNFIECSKLRTRRFMPLDINGVSFQEMKSVLNQAKTNGPRSITIILHSFSFIKPYDVQYNKVKPRWHVIRRFKKLCKFLKENSNYFDIRTFGSLNKEELARMSRQSIHNFPQVPTIFSIMRGVQQLKDILF